MKVYIFGRSTPFVGEVMAVCKRAGWTVVSRHENCDESSQLIRPGSLSGSDLDRLDRTIPVLFPAGTDRGAVRRNAAEAAAALGFVSAAALCDPSAILLEPAGIAAGVYIGPGVVMGAASSLGFGVRINRSASIGHHNQLGAYATIGPAATLAGQIVVDQDAYIGAGAVVLPKVRIGRGAVVGAGAVVTKDVPDNAVVVGNPARLKA